MPENKEKIDPLVEESTCSEQHDSEGFLVLNRRNPNEPNAPTSESRATNEFAELIPTKPNDPIRLKNDVERKLRQLFKERKQTFFEGQYEALQRVNELVLRAPSNSITAVPLVPGGGKSTYIRALLYVLSKHFANIRKDPIAKHIGGVVVVVETSAEAHQLETICVNAGGDSVVAVVEGINDSNLRQYGCPIEKAQSYSDCPRRSCDNYDYCNLAQAAFRTNETPILIMPHARYQRYLENMADLATWTDAKEEEHSRTLLLVDELPNLFESNELSMESIRGAEAELEGLMIPRNAKQRNIIYSLLRQWEWNVRLPFLKLMGAIAEAQCTYGLVQSDAFKDAGFNIDQLKKLRKALAERSPDCAAVKVIDTVLADKTGFFGSDRTTSVTVPHLKKFDKKSNFATIVFSGTAQLAPELHYSGANVVDCPMPESYARLEIIAQHGDRISASRTGLSSQKNTAAIAVWIRYILSQEAGKKALVATYKPFSALLWNALEEAQDCVFLYTDRNGREEKCLPYFGGMNGSNNYSDATCVICAGLNRFQPHEYLDRYLAIGSSTDKLIEELNNGLKSLAASTPVMDLQDIYLAADIIQLVFRSALRNHGTSEPIRLYLFQPPRGVLIALQNFFGDCKIREISDLPEACYLAANTKRCYNKQQTNVGKLLEFLSSIQDSQVTPKDIRESTGLTQPQYKEAMKHPAIRQFMDEHFKTSGSGKNTIYHKRAA